MDLDFSEEQEMLRTSARDFLTVECPKSLVRQIEDDQLGYPPALWKKMADLGWMSLIIPEEFGGAGGNFLDLSIILEEMGRACTPSPFFETVLLGALPIIAAGTVEQKKAYLPRIATGEIILTMAITEPSARFETEIIDAKAIAQNGTYVITGTKLFVPFATAADYLICVLRTSDSQTKEQGTSLFLVDRQQPSIRCTALNTMASDKQFEVLFEGTNTPQDSLLGRLNEGWPTVSRVLEFAAAAKCAEMVGHMQQALEMATSYAKERQQFGRPIGSFQAIQHHCANMLIDTDAARFITYEAAWRLSQNLPASKEVSIAKAFVSEASRRVTLLGHSIFGAIGFTKDHDMQLYYRRSKAAALNYGNTVYHHELVAQELKL